ncbi:MAG: isochorismatase family protein [Bauldia litoralis]
MTDDADLYDTAGFGHSVRRGERPAVVVVDFTYGFTDTAYPTAADMAEPIAATAGVLDAARARKVPVIFTTIQYSPGEIAAFPWLRKSQGMAALLAGSRLVEIDHRLSPGPEEPIVDKRGASAFFGTNLAGMLTGLRVDTLIVAGATTSGCVRATVVDAVQSGFDVLVPRDCVGDRAEGPHEANLFDMHQKYADVISADEACAYLQAVPARQ